MLSVILSGLLQALVVDPLTAEVQETLQRTKAPLAVIAQVEACVTSGAPELVKRVGESPAYGIFLTLDVWLKRTRAEDAIVKAAPSCAPAMEAARPYLRQAKS